MLSVWTELLPLFVVRLLAQRCGRVRVGTKFVHVPRPGVMIEVIEKPDRDDCLTGYGIGV